MGVAEAALGGDFDDEPSVSTYSATAAGGIHAPGWSEDVLGNRL